MPVVVELEHWTHPRLPSSHHLHERWTLMHEGKARLTFSTEDEAREAARLNGWSIEREAARA